MCSGLRLSQVPGPKFFLAVPPQAGPFCPTYGRRYLHSISPSWVCDFINNCISLCWVRKCIYLCVQRPACYLPGPLLLFSFPSSAQEPLFVHLSNTCLLNTKSYRGHSKQTKLPPLPRAHHLLWTTRKSSLGTLHTITYTTWPSSHLILTSFYEEAGQIVSSIKLCHIGSMKNLHDLPNVPNTTEKKKKKAESGPTSSGFWPNSLSPAEQFLTIMYNHRKHS